MKCSDKKDIQFDTLVRDAAAKAMALEMDLLPTREELDKLYPPTVELDRRIQRIIKLYEWKANAFYYANTFIKAGSVIGIILIAAKMLF